ncbi:MAG: endonuclease III [Clostridia bacterium]|nr:endonuclease III [Clostridia bacterium]
MTKNEKKRRVEELSHRLAELYPVSECALEYGGDPWRLLVMARLSAQCTDRRVNIVSKTLFEKYPTPSLMASADISELEEIVRPCGLYRMKAESIKAASEMLVSDFSGDLPRDMDTLLKFPGVGRKIANLLLGDIYKLPAIVCDTHCIRICGRIGLYPEKEKSAERVEKILRSLMDVTDGSDFCHRIVEFGREICSARSPRCEVCPMKDICLHFERNSTKK